ncbi:G-alpha-domain-containing protein [Cylindrobasidium torrendii FP15055 ss-10]|uniref:G-alpha-domain-containing protein n=1 Tax=Cylindrobasidium torrendii FP15055 ss-10 TaxID=1314674 RepID=A0A0D7AYV1_9AGAR|nr:G-alpha-domain-containing protein [Cylindrobasidium torrendii FP15055 ss-10]
MGTTSEDPLDAALRPPENETATERAVRLAREAHAREVSAAIDANIRAERQAKKKKKIVRLLLLGQSESGKSTTLRQFQRLYTPTAFREERVLWRAVIQLNVVRSVRVILDALSQPCSPGVSPARTHSNRPRPRPRQGSLHTHSTSNTSHHGGMHADEWSHFRPDASGSFERADSGAESDSDGEIRTTTRRSSRFEHYQQRLIPLRHTEQLLIAKLVPPNEDEATHLGRRSPVKQKEVFVRPGPLWKGALARARVHFPAQEALEVEPRRASAGDTGLESADEVQETLHACAEDMIDLWHDKNVQRVLKRKKIRLEELPGFFLNDLERVTALRYSPSDDDVLKARLKTVGVAEYKFEMEVQSGRESATEWRIVDVGGSRSQRQTWMPFFDDVDAILFLAPISGFDQVLAEDNQVNRLEDSVLLWKGLCSNKLLQNVELVLFLNKCDILEKKLESGVRMSRYIRSYDKPNDFPTVSKYLMSKFNAIHREYSPKPRKFYAFCTSVTDTTTTAGIIASVRDMVVRENLKKSKLL